MEEGRRETTERWRRVEALYNDMLALPASERASALASACRDDLSLAVEVQSLLDQPESAAGFLNEPALDLAARAVSPAGASMIGRRIGSFEVRSLIGIGGMGEVYRAHDSKLGRDVAIKVLPSSVAKDADRLSRFRREARLLASLNHPNIASIHGLEESDGTFALVMEMVEGEDLAERLKRGPIPVDEAITIAKQIAEGLEAAHEKGIVHRDLKPANIKLTKEGAVKILDFGLAKAYESEITAADASALSDSPTMSRRMTEAGMILGTAAYMSPEQARGAAVDKRADIWSFGLVLLEMLTGQVAFNRGSTSETLAAVLRDAPPLEALPRETPPSIRRVLERCLERDPRRRLRDIGDALWEMEPFRAAAPSGDRAPRSASRLSRWAAVIALITAAGLGLWAGSRWIAKSGSHGVELPNFRQLTFRNGTVFNAQFAADGQSIVYSAAFDGGPMSTFLVRTARPESQSLATPSGLLLALSGRDDVALSRNCQFIPSRSECLGTMAIGPLTGGAFRDQTERVTSADYSPVDNRTMAVIRADGKAGLGRLEFPSGTVVTEEKGGETLSHVRISPDGRKVAFSFSEAQGVDNASIRVLEAGASRTLATGLRFPSGIAWSADGREVWFSAQTPPTWQNNIYAVDLVGNLRVVLRETGQLRLLDIGRAGGVLLSRGEYRLEAFLDRPDGSRTPQSWFDFSSVDSLSRDGTLLLFSERGRARMFPSYDLFVRKTDGSPPIALGEGRGLALSRDGRFALAHRSVQGRAHELIVYPTGAGSPRVVSSGMVLDAFADFLPDGSAVVFVERKPDGSGRTWVKQLAGESAPRRLDYESGAMISPLSPDGGRFISRRDDGSVWLAHLDGTPSTPVKGLGPGQNIAQWTADGRALYVYSVGARGNYSVERVDIATGARAAWRTVELADPTGWVPGFTRLRITPDGRTIAHVEHRQLSSLFLATGLK